MIIDKDKYQGYIWKSDEQSPTVYDGSRNIEKMEINDDANPFIIEGLLFSEKSRKSISIKYVDGKHIVDIRENIHHSADDILYIPNSRLKLEEGKMLAFKREWTEITDDLNMNWPTLYPSGLIFTGFVDTKKKGE